MLKYTNSEVNFVIKILFLERIECHKCNPYFVGGQKCRLKDKKFWKQYFQ